MIIDLILDRKDNSNRVIKDGKAYSTPEYNAKRFYDEIVGWEELGWEIAEALDSGENEDVQRELCNYIIEHEYNPDICNYIKSVNWL